MILSIQEPGALWVFPTPVADRLPRLCPDSDIHDLRCSETVPTDPSVTEPPPREWRLAALRTSFPGRRPCCRSPRGRVRKDAQPVWLWLAWWTMAPLAP